MKAYDIMSEHEWGQLLAELQQEVGMAASLTDAAGNRLQTNGDEYPLCAAIRADKQTLTFICAQTNHAMLVEIREELQPVVDQCEAGLVRLVVPVTREGQLVAQVTACGRTDDRDNVDLFLVAKQLSISEDEVAQLLGQTPELTLERAQQAAHRLFARLNP